MNIFIIDGSKVGAGSFTMALANHEDFQIIGFVESAINVLDTVRRITPDVVILDIEMPGRSGIGVLRELKRDLPNMPVIIFTRASNINYRAKCEEAGADYFFDKFREVQKVPLALKALTLRKSRPVVQKSL